MSFDEKTDAVRGQSLSEKVVHTEVLADSDLLNEAYTAENDEHAMGILEAIKAHPMACFWGFIMCFTIVSSSSRKNPAIPCSFSRITWLPQTAIHRAFQPHFGTEQPLILPCRSWSRSTCS